MFRLCLGVGHNLPGLLLGLSQLVLGGLLNRLLGFGPFLMDLIIGLVQFGLTLGLELFRLGQSGFGLAGQLLVMLLPLCHKFLDRLEEKEMQPSCENDQVHPMQQNLLPINIQRHVSHLPYNTKMMRMTTRRA